MSTLLLSVHCLCAHTCVPCPTVPGHPAGPAAYQVAFRHARTACACWVHLAHKSRVWLLRQERGNNNAKAWQAAVQSALGGSAAWPPIGLRQLSGMLIMVFARAHLQVRSAGSSSICIQGDSGWRGCEGRAWWLSARFAACHTSVCPPVVRHLGCTWLPAESRRESCGESITV